MDGHRFDAWTRAFATRLNRRQTLKAVVAGVLGGGIGARHLLSAEAQGGPVEVCYRTGNPRKPFHFLTLDPRVAQRLRTRSNFVVCDADEVLDRETCTCHPQGANPKPSEPDDPGCVAVGEECRRNGECCSHWCAQGICQCTGSGANCASQEGEVEVCYQTGNRFRPHVTFSVSMIAASRLKGRRGYVVCDDGETLDTATCTCKPEMGESEPGPSCGAVGAACQNNGDCCGNVVCSNGVCICSGWGEVCDGDDNLDAQCCSNSCVNNICACLGTNAACTNDRGCCSGSCVNGTCACSTTGAACQADGECCSDSCENGACVCASIGTACDVDSDCCINACVNGLCACLETGASCQENAQCCSDQCVNGTCSCLVNGVACNANSACCSGECANDICVCGQTGAVCAANSDCCSGLCLADGHCGCTPGQCPPGQVCHENTCCAPNCPAGAQCGDDGCGGVCGTCSDDGVCMSCLDCGVETCPTDMSQWCTNGECCFPPLCANPGNDCSYACVLTTEGNAVCSDGSTPPAPCSSSSDCPAGQACVWSCGFGNNCQPIVT